MSWSSAPAPAVASPPRSSPHAGLSVTVLERGGYHNESDFTHLESDAYSSMYLDGGLNSTSDGGVLMLAGSTLGGGTVVNYTTSFATPDSVREEWDRVAGFSNVFVGDEFAESLTAVENGLGVNKDHGTPSARDQIMEKGLRNLGWHVDEQPRNVNGCTEEACGYCTMGCRIGAKRSTLATYLQDAAEGGARIVVDADVRLIDTDQGRVAGVVASVGDHTLTVRARAVVLAAGALNSPALLLRSGLGGRAAGQYLRIHPVTALWGRFEERVDPWTGMLQTRYSDEFADLDGQGYGFRFETAPVHPLFPAAFVGWEDGPSFKRDILGLGHLAVAGILLRDHDHGRVTVRRDGSPLWKYRISDYDRSACPGRRATGCRMARRGRRCRDLHLDDPTGAMGPRQRHHRGPDGRDRRHRVRPESDVLLLVSSDGQRSDGVRPGNLGGGCRQSGP